MVYKITPISNTWSVSLLNRCTQYHNHYFCTYVKVYCPLIYSLLSGLIFIWLFTVASLSPFKHIYAHLKVLHDYFNCPFKSFIDSVKWICFCFSLGKNLKEFKYKWHKNIKIFLGNVSKMSKSLKHIWLIYQTWMQKLDEES